MSRLVCGDTNKKTLTWIVEVFCFSKVFIISLSHFDQAYAWLRISFFTTQKTKTDETIFKNQLVQSDDQYLCVYFLSRILY